MSQIALVGLSSVNGGPGATGPGQIIGPGGIGQFGDGLLVSVVGDLIASHGPAPHDIAVMIQGSPDTYVNNLPLCRVGDLASCGCVVIAGDFDAYCI